MVECYPSVKRLVINMAKNYGEVLQIDKIKNNCEEFSEEEVMKSIKELEGEGIVTFLGKESIQVII